MGEPISYLAILVGLSGIVVAILAIVVPRPWELGSKIEQLRSRIDEAQRSLENKIDAVERRLESRIDGVERRLARVEQHLTFVYRGLLGTLHLFGSLITLLGRKAVLTEDEKEDLTTSVSRLMGGVEAMGANPLSPEEMERLRSYVIRAETKGGPFTAEEVRDYMRLVKKLEAEKPDDPSVYVLLALGAFLLGLVLGGREKQ